MKALSFVMFAFLMTMQLDLLANDHSLNEYDMKDEFEEFAAIHFSELTEKTEMDCLDRNIIIYDMKANILRQAVLSSGCSKNNGSILWPLLNRSQFLTEVNGVMIYLFDETYR